MTSRHYKVIGTTEDYAGCDCCGRMNLKVYVALEPVEGGPVVFFGTGCAAKAEKIPAAEIKAEAKAADAARREAEMVERRARQAEADARWFAFLDAAAGPGEVTEQIRRLGGFAAAAELYKVAA
jgi:hypothetical protein